MVVFRGGGGLNVDKNSLLVQVAIKSGLVEGNATKITRRQKQQLKKAIHVLANEDLNAGIKLKGFSTKEFNPRKLDRITTEQCMDILEELVDPTDREQSINKIAHKLAIIKEKQSQKGTAQGPLPVTKVESVPPVGLEGVQRVSPPPANGLGLAKNKKVSNVSSVDKRNRILKGLCQQEGRTPNEGTGITKIIREAKDMTKGYFTQNGDTTKLVAALSKHIGNQNKPQAIAKLVQAMADSGDMRNIVEALGKLEKMEGVSAASLTKVVRKESQSNNYSHLNSDTNGWDRVFKAVTQENVYDSLDTRTQEESPYDIPVPMRANILYEPLPRRHANSKDRGKGPNINPSG